jgi:Nickel/cobalt transporter regulator
MKSLVLTGIAATALAFVITPATASDSFAIVSSDTLTKISSSAAFGEPGHGPMPTMPSTGHGPMPMPGMGHGGHGPMPGMGNGGHGPRPGMPMVMGHGPRPGFHGIPRTDIYRRPFRGFILPSYWVQPTFYVSNWGNYGLRAPSNGYNWSRYYDDAVLTDRRGYVYDYQPGVQWNGNGGNYVPAGGYRQPDYAPAIRPDAQAYNWNDQDDLAYSAPDGSKYDYDGGWRGDYVDPQARVYEGQWNGRVTRYDANDPGAYPARGPQNAGAPYPPQSRDDYPYEREDRYSVPQGYERYEQCLRESGLAGGAIGAILGGVAGNRIAGRGDRLGGTILGAGLGGLAGVGIEKATNKCRKYMPQISYGPRPGTYPAPQTYPYPQQGYPQGGYPQQGGYQPGYQGGYYYYPQAAPMVTTVTVVPGGSTTTTTTTEEVTYETVYSAPRRHHAVRKWKPKPKPRPRATCNCTIQGS